MVFRIVTIPVTLRDLQDHAPDISLLNYNF